MITALGAIRELGVRLRLLQLGEYIRGIEAEFRVEGPDGWEHYLSSARKKPTNALLGISNILIWSTFVLTTFLVAIGIVG